MLKAYLLTHMAGISMNNLARLTPSFFIDEQII